MAREAMTSAPAVFGRLAWMIVGPFTLAVCAISIAQRGDGRLSPADLIYLLALGEMMIGRRTEFRYSQPLTATGEPAMADHLRRYTLLLSTLGIWVAAKLIGNKSIHVLG
jgi:hypothetical protein